MAELLKNLYTKNYIEKLSVNIHVYYKDFDKNSFVDFIFDSSWDDLELKQRMRHITNAIKKYLPNSYKLSIDILKKSFLKKNLNEQLQDMVYQDYVGVYGVDDYDVSINALEHFTINSSSEFAIREFILKYEDKTMEQMKIWAKSKNIHVRRLASEGCRSRLPWAKALPKFKKDPSKVIEVLEILQDDTELYVKKSVANNINDISKDNNEIVITLAKEWYGQNEHKNWIIKHACRTLLKQGNQEVLEIFGYKSKPNIKLNNFICDAEVYLGENINFSFEIEDNDILDKLRIEYSIDFLRQNNKTNNKVFFIAQKEFNNKVHNVNKNHSFKLINTRKYYEGIHTLNIIINGVVLDKKEFKVKLK